MLPITGKGLPAGARQSLSRASHPGSAARRGSAPHRWARAAALGLSLALFFAAGIAGTAAPPDTAAQLDAILAADHRSPANRARDVYRHPKETLLFFGIAADSRVAELWPEPGWYTEIIAPLVRARGKYYAALQPPDPGSRHISAARQAFLEKLAGRPDLYDRVGLTTLAPPGTDIAPAGSLDLVVSFRNLHDWMAEGWAAQAIAAAYRALKPGGVLGIVEHRGNAAQVQDPQARSGYVNQDYAERLIEAAGFELLERSEINANPRDRKDYPQGVWTLPPSYRLGATDRDDYAAIGESDRFTLKFRKPSR